MKKLILIGFGSIGRFHLSKMLNAHVYIVDPKFALKNFAKDIRKKDNIKVYKKVTDLPKLDFHGAAISNWGPDHFDSFRSLVKLGVKNFLIEKPLVDSLYDLYELEKIKKKLKLKISVHLQWNFSNLKNRLETISESHNLGYIRSVIVFGGAKCLVMNGIHYLALASKLFDSAPLNVTSNVSGRPINPRGEQFQYYEGSMNFTYKGFQYLCMHFSNSSKVSAELVILFHNGIARINDNKMVVTKITEDKLISDSRIVKTFTPTEIVYSGEAYKYEDESDGSDFLYKNFLLNRVSKGAFEQGLSATEWIIRGLVSNELISNLKTERIKKVNLKRKWGIT